MDTITHALTGYAIGSVLYSKNDINDNRIMYALRASVTIGAISPDIDIVTKLYGGNTLYFMSHRTLTHSPVGILLLSVLCSFGVKAFIKDSNYTKLLVGTFIGLLSHVLLDVTNIYSTLSLWPISDRMYSLGFVAIVDAVFLGILIISIVISYIKPLRIYERRIFAAALSIIVCYIGVRACMQNNLKDYLIYEYKRGSISVKSNPPELKKVSVLTDYVGINSWNFIMENEDEYVKGTVRFSDHKITSITSIKKKPFTDIAFPKAVSTPLGKFLMRFTPYIDYSVNAYKDGYIVHMVDVRYTFPLKLSKNQPGYSHILGAYIILDKNYNPVSWSTKDPLSTHLQF